MTAFVCVLERSGAAVRQEQLERLAEPLEPYGSHFSTLCSGPVGIAVRHRAGFAIRRRQGPFQDPDSGRIFAVVGWYGPADGHGFPQGNSPQGDNAPAAQAAEAISRLARKDGEQSDPIAEFLSGISGPFTLVVADPATGSLEVVRDHLGSVMACYALVGDQVIAASEPTPILRHDAVAGDPDEISAARFLGFRFDSNQRTFFRGIRELPAAHRLQATRHGVRVASYWRFAPPTGEAERSPRSITSEFREQLARAVKNDLSGCEPSRAALSLSGGLDSTALAAVVPRGVQAFSWIFDGLADADERQRVEAVSQHLDLPVHWIPGDGLLPLADDFIERFVDTSSPFLNPFAALKQRLYSRARSNGCQRILVGDGGDALYAARDFWLRDALAAREPGALRSLAGAIRRAVAGDRRARTALRRTLPLRRLPRLWRGRPEPWLTAEALALLPPATPSPIVPSAGWEAGRYELTVGARNSELESEERRLFARCGVERGNPFWSWPLLQSLIHLPATWSQRGGRSKILTREAFRGRLPETVLEGPRGGLLGSLFLRGLERHRKVAHELVFRRPHSDWPRYVRREWLEPFLSDTRTLAFGHTILWRVLSYELWQRRLARGAAGAGGSYAGAVVARGPRPSGAGSGDRP